MTDSTHRTFNQFQDEQHQAAWPSQQYADEIRDLYNNAPCGYHSLDQDGVFIQINDTELSWLGLRREEVVGKMGLADFLTAESRQLFQENFPRFKEQGRVRDVEFQLVCQDGSLRTVLLSATAIKDEAGDYLMSRSTLYDITERKQAEEQFSLLQTITMEVAAASDLSSALRVVLRRVCEQTGWVYGQAWLPRRDGTVLDCGPAWFSDAGLEKFRDSSMRLSFPAGRGLPGRVWQSKQPVWLEDATLDANFPRAEFAVESGLKAALALPILTGGGIIAVIEFFLRETRGEDERLVKVITVVAAQLGLVIERKRAEDALRASEERFSKAFALSPSRMGIIRIKDGVVLDVNARWVQEMGFSREEIIGQSLFELKEWLRYEKETRLSQLLKEGKPFRDVELYMSTRSGEKRVILSSAEVIELDGEPCFLAVANDITERKQAEERLLKEKHLTEQIINCLPGIFYAFDQQGRFQRWNENFERVTGYSGEELKQISPLDLFTGKDQEKIQQCLRKVFQKGESAADVELVAKDGTRTPYYFTGRRVSFDDQVCDVGMGIDVTEQKQTEEQLRATSQQLRALTASVSSAREEEGIRIAREIHDELGSSLTSLRWDLESLDKTVSESKDQSQLRPLREKIAAMIGLTDTTIGAVRRISSELRPSVLDDLGLMEAIEWQAQQFQARTGIICQCDSSLENLELSQEQSTAVFRIFQEALTNILRHAQATRVEITVKEEAGHFVLTIRDDGRGITEDERSGSQSLGLLGMRERVHLIGGEIDINGIEGKGTVVAVRVPISGSASVRKQRFD